MQVRVDGLQHLTSTIVQNFMDSCLILWPSGIKYDKVSMVVTDQAIYMVAAFSNPNDKLQRINI